MKTEYFPHFIRKNFPGIEISNEDAIEIGKEFKKYLDGLFEDKPRKLDEITDISPMSVIMNQGHPFYTNGYHSALVLHFTEFVEIQKSKQ